MTPPEPQAPPPRIGHLRALTKLMDEAVPIPGTDYTVGLDALLGLFPGIGDGLSALAASYLILSAHRLGAPASVLVRMLGNMGIDAAVGAIPFLGDLFDIGFKANRRNLDLLEAHLQSPEGTRRRSNLMVVGFGLGLLVMLGAVATLLVGIAMLFADLITG